MENVTIVITQEGATIATLYTDVSGDAATTINAGVYTCTFSYPDRLPVSTTITIAYDNTYLVFAFPDTAVAGSSIVSVPVWTNEEAFLWQGAAEIDITVVEPTFVCEPVFDNSAP